jgi:hypothetical protein
MSCDKMEGMSKAADGHLIEIRNWELWDGLKVGENFSYDYLMARLESYWTLKAHKVC